MPLAIVGKSDSSYAFGTEVVDGPFVVIGIGQGTEGLVNTDDEADD